MGTGESQWAERQFRDVSISIVPHDQSKVSAAGVERPPTFNLPSVLSLAPGANVSDFIMQSVTIPGPVSLFRARAKARISIECGPFECGSFECGSVRVRGAHSSHLNRCLPRPWSKWWAPRRAGMDGLWRERRRRLSCFAAASPPRSPLCGLITRQRWGCSALWTPLLHSTTARKKGGKGHKVSVMLRLVRDQAVWAIAHCHCPPLSLDPPSTCCKEGQPYQGSHRCSNI